MTLSSTCRDLCGTLKERVSNRVKLQKQRPGEYFYCDTLNQFLKNIKLTSGFPGGSISKESACNARGSMVLSLSREAPLEWKQQPASLPGKPHGQRRPVGCCPRGSTSRVWQRLNHHCCHDASRNSSSRGETPWSHSVVSIHTSYLGRFFQAHELLYLKLLPDTSAPVTGRQGAWGTWLGLRRT